MRAVAEEVGARFEEPEAVVDDVAKPLVDAGPDEEVEAALPLLDLVAVGVEHRRTSHSLPGRALKVNVVKVDLTKAFIEPVMADPDGSGIVPLSTPKGNPMYSPAPKTVKAIVVLREGQSATEEEVIDFCRDKLGGFERPRSVDFVTELPRNATGKVLKRELREPFWAGHKRRVAGA